MDGGRRLLRRPPWVAQAVHSGKVTGSPSLSAFILKV
jgi:hypothetical protein